MPGANCIMKSLLFFNGTGKKRMKITDILRFAFQASIGYPTRTLLMLLAMAIGVGSVAKR